jgi:endonuclease/exonuclease/phosphatase family metal-dependent hydrolase
MSLSFRLATFNLENLEWSLSREEEFAHRLATLTPTLNALAADVLCLQEIGAQKKGHHGDRRFLALDRLFSGGPYESFQRETSVRPGTTMPADVHNLAILSRWPIVERKQLFHDFVAKWSWIPPGEEKPIEVSFDRPLLYARIAPPDGAPLHVINLHLRAPRAVPLYSGDACPVEPSRVLAEGQFLAAQKREGQALEARLFVDSLFDAEPDARIAVCGDFNSEEHDAPARILSGVDNEGHAQASPRILIPLAARIEKERRYSVLHEGRRALLDHIFASLALSRACGEVLILNAGLPDEATTREPIFGSFHAPVAASFDLAK